MNSQVDNSNLDELIQKVEAHHETYLQSLHSLHNTLGQRRRERSDSRTTINEQILSPLRTSTGPVFSSDPSSSPFPRRSALDTRDRVPLCPSPKPLVPGSPKPNSHHGSSDCVVHEDELCFIPLLDATTTIRSSNGNGNENPPSNAVVMDEAPRTTKLLTPMSFTDDMLLRHLRDSEFWGESARVLEDVLKRRDSIDLAMSFRDFASYEREGYVSATFEMYDVAADATVLKKSREVDVQGVVKYAGDGPYEAQDEIVDAPLVWESIKDVNRDGETVGRITIVQEPTPLILAALHLTMSPHFDMSEILHHFLSEIPNRGRTHACMHRAFEREPYIPSAPKPDPGISFSNLRQRSFFFVFKYYTVVGEGLEPAPWQGFDKRPSDERTGDHVDIAECGSILALSLEGEPTKPLRIRPRRERKREGFLFDTFGPWHLLSIQSFPDDEHTVRDDEFQQKSFYNGPYAFLDLLITEYRDAGKRNQVLHERITKLITPPTEFMFDRKLRDKLLFEDKHFTYIRRYFWAYNTLAVINTGLKAMISAYVDTFTPDFWSGHHPLLWPIPSALSAPDADAYREKMTLLRRELDKVVGDLGEVLKRNERTRKEIENLRDQLFSGSSIKESRRAIDQGDNIRILTVISMIFLPLTFVTSVFGMTEFTIGAGTWQFGLCMVLVSVPFMILVLLLQTRLFNRVLARSRIYFIRLVSLASGWVGSIGEPGEVSDNVSTIPLPRGSRKRGRPLAGVERPERTWKWPWTDRSGAVEGRDGMSRV